MIRLLNGRELSRNRCAIGILVALSLLFAITMVISFSLLPERVATHFNGRGDPNGWMSRPAHLLFMSLFATLFTLFLMGLGFASRSLPADLINIPNRNYWLTESRREEFSLLMISHFTWLASLGLSFVAVLNWAIVSANKREPAHLPVAWVRGSTAVFLASVALWSAILFWRLRRRSDSSAVR